jgi:hypothetical protein
VFAIWNVLLLTSSEKMSLQSRAFARMQTKLTNILILFVKTIVELPLQNGAFMHIIPKMT